MATPPLTKSRFRLGWECPAKLYFSNHKDVYHNALGDDPFIQGLADGGYQVGEFARWMLCRQPVADMIDTLDKAQALAETRRRLGEPAATVAEAAFEKDDLFIRADIIVKAGNALNLYEVKSKSWEKSESFWTEKGPRKLRSGWEEYLLDVAFQKYVIKKACPGFTVQAHLVLMDKEKSASVDGLCQMFPVFRQDNDIRVRPRISKRSGLGRDLLAYVNVDRDIDEMWKLAYDLPDGKTGRFDALVGQLAHIQKTDKPFFCGIGAKCKNCQFRLPGDPAACLDLQSKGLKSGREECWAKAVGAGYQGTKPKVIELWNFRKTDDMISERKYFLSDLSKNDLGSGVRVGRQWRQVDKASRNDSTPWIDGAGLTATMAQWEFPLHFIDFETARMALPGHKGMSPYTQVAFQFSHHTVGQDGSVRHAGQWIDAQAGSFPSFEFVRALKKELEKDEGTIFRYAAHENSVLRDIHDQLSISREPDRLDLMRWIDTITGYRQEGAKQADPRIKGERNMVDMKAVVVDFHYDPATHGSNSLKYVLPAIISNSQRLRAKYGSPIGHANLHSLNFPPDWVWIQPSNGNNPYASLPPIFSAEEQEGLSAYVRGLDEIDDGGAATIAYAKLQFCEVPDHERESIRQALLRYCELDTLAMVMLYEYWRQVTA